MDKVNTSPGSPVPAVSQPWAGPPRGQQPGSEKITALFQAWYTDRTAKNLNALVEGCEYPAKLALSLVGKKLRRRTDLNTDDLKHAGLVGIWKTIIRRADDIHAFSQHHGLVAFFKQAAGWEMLRELGTSRPFDALPADARLAWGRVGRSAESLHRETGIRPTDEQITARAGVSQTYLETLRARAYQVRLDNHSEDGQQGWPTRLNPDVDTLDTKDIVDTIKGQLDAKDQWKLDHKYLKGLTTGEFREAARASGIGYGLHRARESRDFIARLQQTAMSLDDDVIAELSKGSAVRALNSAGVCVADRRKEQTRGYEALKRTRKLAAKEALLAA